MSHATSIWSSVPFEWIAFHDTICDYLNKKKATPSPSQSQFFKVFESSALEIHIHFFFYSFFIFRVLKVKSQAYFVRIANGCMYLIARNIVA